MIWVVYDFPFLELDWVFDEVMRPVALVPSLINRMSWYNHHPYDPIPPRKNKIAHRRNDLLVAFFCSAFKSDAFSGMISTSVFVSISLTCPLN
jgi:hypothetical protein